MKDDMPPKPTHMHPYGGRDCVNNRGVTEHQNTEHRTPERLNSEHLNAQHPMSRHPKPRIATLMGDTLHPTPAAIFLLGTITSLIFVFLIYSRQGVIASRIDLNGFGLIGRHIASGDGFSLGYGPTLRRAPLYPLFTAAILRLTGNYSSTIPDEVAYRPILIVQCLLFGLTCLSVYALGRKLFGTRIGIISGIVCAVLPQTLRYVGMTEVETLLALLITLSALTGLSLYRTPKLRHGFLFGLTCAAATLVKPVALFYIFVYSSLYLLILLKRRENGNTQVQPRTDVSDAAVRITSTDIKEREQPHRSRQKLIPLAVAIFSFVLCLAPWLIRNYTISGGQFIGISSNGPGEFLRGYVLVKPEYIFLRKDFGGTNSGVSHWDWEADLYEDEILRKHGDSFFSRDSLPGGEMRPMEPQLDRELSKERIESQEVRHRILHEPFGFLCKFCAQLFTFWYIVETRGKSLLIGFSALIMLVLAIFGWSDAKARGIDTTPVISVVIYYHILYAIILAFARYSMLVYPTLIVMSVYGVRRLASILSANRMKPM